MQIHKKFAFDSSVPQKDFEKYINPDDLLNESFEKLKGEFEAYRRKRGKDIIKEEQLQRRQAQELRQKHQSQPQTAKSEEGETIRPVIGLIDAFLKGQEQKCKQLHQRVFSPKFGYEENREKQQIQKSEVHRIPIFNDADFERLIQKEEEEEEMYSMRKQNQLVKRRKGFVNQRGKYKSQVKPEENSEKLSQHMVASSKMISRKNSEGTEKFNTGQQNKQRFQLKSIDKQQKINDGRKAAKRCQLLSRTWEKFGIFSPSEINFRVQSMMWVKLQKLDLKGEDIMEKSRYAKKKEGTKGTDTQTESQKLEDTTRMRKTFNFFDINNLHRQNIKQLPSVQT